MAQVSANTTKKPRHHNCCPNYGKGDVRFCGYQCKQPDFKSRTFASLSSLDAMERGTADYQQNSSYR